MKVYVIFKFTVAQRVLSKKNLELNGSQLTVCPVTRKEPKVEADPRVIYVSWVSKETDKETLTTLQLTQATAVDSDSLRASSGGYGK